MICTANQLTGFYMRATLVFNGLSHKHRVKFVNKPGATSERILDVIIDGIIMAKSEYLVIHVCTNDVTKGIDLLNNAKKIVKKVNKKLPKTCIAFSSIINRKDKKVGETNQRLEKYCRQKDINYIENTKTSVKIV